MKDEGRAEMERLTYEIIDGGMVTDKENIKEFEIEDGFTVYAGNAVFRLADYEDTGLTPEQVRELKERNTAKVPDYEGDGCDKDGNIIYDTWICPNCGEKYEVDYDDYEHCPKCGQAIQWENLEGMEDGRN